MNFNLHSLGWKAFQDLCASVMSEVLGQNVQVFAATRDRGRDAAFQGAWRPEHFGVAGTYAVQCKHTSRQNVNLNTGDLAAEIEKVKRLAALGLADNYVLMTNYGVTGEAEEGIRRAFLGIDGVKAVHVFGAEWINAKISENPRLRALVPRLYGLGDLSEILDDRAYKQARELIASMGDDLRKLVVTRAQQDSARALLDHGFVLLLGDPATGKSTIAAALSIAAADNYGLRMLNLRSPEQLTERWNPDNPRQLIWVDDAFGTTQYRKDLADEWNRTFRHMAAAMRIGTRFILTSRTYIYLRARTDLKVEAFPIISRSQVVIHVEQLTRDEKQQILYNHIKLGDQERAFKLELRQHLRRIAANPRFLPETARRLGNRLFTQRIVLDRFSLDQFVQYPIEHLLDVIRSIDAESRAGLSLIFMRGGRLSSPVSITPEEERIVSRLGAEPRDTANAIQSLNGSLTKYTVVEDQPYWAFHHPTVAGAMAEYIAANSELVDVYLAGMPIDTLAQEVVCGAVQLEGAKVVVPRSMFEDFSERLMHLPESKVANFLVTRADRNFCELILQNHPEILGPLDRHHRLIPSRPVFPLAQKLWSLGLLPEDARRNVAQSVGDALEYDYKVRLLEEDGVVALLTPEELHGMREFVSDEFAPSVRRYIDGFADDWPDTEDPDAYFDEFIEELHAAERIGAMTSDDVFSALHYISDKVEYMMEHYKPEGEPDYDYDGYGGGGISESSDDIFSDVAD